MSFKACFRILISLPFCLYFSKINAQGQTEEIFIQLLESLNQEVELEYDHSELLEQWNYFRKYPLNLNKAGREDLGKLFFLSELQINAILKHREDNGLFLDILELQTIQELDIPSVRLIASFVKIELPNSLSLSNAGELLKKSEQELILRFGTNLDQLTMVDQSERKYPGSSLRMLARYRYNYRNRLYASLNMEKDAGEQFFAGGNSAGFDFYSGNVYLKDAGIFKKLLLGDYSLQFGQGLAMWTGSGFGKGAVLNSIARQGHGLKPHSSINEVLFLRGVAASIALNKVLFTPFISFRKHDASVSDNGNEIRSVILSGLHRTEAEIENKSRLSSFLFGANARLSLKKFNMGATVFHTKYNIPFAPGLHMYQQNDFVGNRLINGSVYYSYTFRNTYFFGELAHSFQSGTAIINGLMSSLSTGVSLVLLQRNYAKNYHSFFNQTFSESSEAFNERGFLAGVDLKLDPGWEFFAFTDFFRFPWPKFRVDGPSKGYENFARLTYKPDKRFRLIAQLKQQIKQENPDLSLNSSGLENVRKDNYRVEISYQLNNRFTLRNRMELVTYQKMSVNREYGFLTYQDIIYDPMGSRLSAHVRFGIFDTESFNSRIYTYENDVLYSYSVPAFQGSGLRFYVNTRYTFSERFDIWLRYAHKSFRDELNTGYNNPINQSDIRLQIRYQF